MARFVTKALSGRWDTDRVTTAVFTAVKEGCPRGWLLELLAAEFPDWGTQIATWKASQAAMTQRVYEAATDFEAAWPLYMRNALPSVLIVIEKHRDRDCSGDPQLFDAFVTSDFIESFFGCLKDSWLQLGKIDIKNVTGIAAAKKIIPSTPQRTGYGPKKLNVKLRSKRL